MKKNVVALMFFAALFFVSACNQNESNTQGSLSVNQQIATSEIVLESDSIGYTLFQNKCMACHSVAGKMHDELIAPPMIAVKRRYSMVYSERDDFIKNIVAWAKDPKAENAIMRGAVNKFKTMPYLNFEEEDLKKIAAFIYENEMEKPDWFDEHFKEMHPNGLGQGKGKGKNKGKMKKK
jgi:mono/diheme cytochrome c family protein